MTAKMEDFEDGQELSREDFLKNFSLKKEKKPPKKKEVKIMTAEEEERLVKQEVKKIKEEQRDVQEQMDAADVATLFRERPQLTTSDVERDVRLLKVSGHSSKERMLHPVLDEKTNEVLGYRAIDTDNPFNEIFDEDMTLANLDSEELNVIREHCNLSNFSQALSQSTGISLVECQNFYKNQLKSFLVSSRAKKGFAAWLVKTEKSISEGTLERIQKEVEEKKKKRWGLF